MSKEEEEAENEEKEDVVDELEVVDYSLPSLASMTNYSLHTWQAGRRNSKRTVERKISVSSIMSEDSFSMDHLEEAGAAIGAAVGISKVSSGLRESRRRKSLSRYCANNSLNFSREIQRILTFLLFCHFDFT